MLLTLYMCYKISAPITMQYDENVYITVMGGGFNSKGRKHLPDLGPGLQSLYPYYYATVLESGFGERFWRAVLESGFGEQFWRAVLEDGSPP